MSGIRNVLGQSGRATQLVRFPLAQVNSLTALPLMIVPFRWSRLRYGGRSFAE